MKINRHSIYLVLLTVFALSWQACEKLIDPSELPTFVQKIVVNVVSSNIEGSKMEVSLTASPYDSTDYPTIVDDAIIQFKVNGIEQNFTYNPSSELYENPNTFDPGDQLQLTVSLQNKSTVSAAVVMPPDMSNLSSKLVLNGGTDGQGHTADLIQLSFDDDPNSPNYYLLHFYYYSELANLFLPFEMTTTDAILNSPQTIKTNAGGYLFADETFNGRNRSFSVVAPAGIVESNTDIRYLVEIHSLSRDYYVYMKTLQDFRDSQDNTGGATTLGTAVVVHSNISGGLGIFGTKTVASDTLR